ncbi:transcription-repair coupling factor [uncultured Limosilactobacillus sp.]|uniref:transcription-repair coupling factor n=1 Tax=uncultured Limosilactobacillus sp. TaxID=2837629 RepID=UPI0025E75EFA|nr:transcription-repair coupling factor [uncultured Limosilactobacillus sp.]
MQIEELVEKTSQFKQIQAGFQAGGRQLVTGLSGSAETTLLAALQQQSDQPLVVVTDSLFHMQALATDLENLLPETAVYQFPVEESLAMEIATSSPDFRLQRVQALNALLQKKSAVIVTATGGLRRPLVAPQIFAQARLMVKVGDDLDPQAAVRQLTRMGYQRQKMVMAPGDFAIRGSIIDIYALNTSNPVRIDLFDTEVDSLRYFEANSQRSIKNIQSVTVLPATDLIIDPQQLPQVQELLKNEYAKLHAKATDEQDARQIENHFRPLLASLAAGSLENGLLTYADLIYPKPASLFDYLPVDGRLIIEDFSRIKEANQNLATDEQQWLQERISYHQRQQQGTLGNDAKQLIINAQQSGMFLARFKKGMGSLRFKQITELTARSMQQFFGQMELLKTELERFRDQGETVIIMTKSDERRRKVAQTLQEFQIDSVETAVNDLQLHKIQLVAANLNHGFDMPAAQLVVITEAEMFQQVKKRRPRAQKLANAERIKNYTDLKPGDYVVHVNHGIGIFAGIKTMTVDGVHQDYIVIDYRDHAQIFVPVTQLNLVQKYVSSESSKPRINKLGGNEWAKTKRQVAQKIENIAGDLVDLYAQRKTAKGFAYPKDDYLQEKFDREFPYSETKDQLRSINEVKADMEQPKPMDRLLVGDVGYGKTEVALRAIFKAVTGGKQVAFLVPTTILAQQHYDTMRERFEGFPVKIEMMSRFRTPKQMKTIEKGLADGSIDVVVGTHRLLSKDVHFKDLGLLIVDEEQRFGVKHKEKLKQLKANVDVLTLTATPIPRTLHMSMLGVRDLSVLETPPVGRFPIQTYVLEQNWSAIRDGILREMKRGGQVYYLHNRVNDIERVVHEIETLVPEARVADIHGQMTEAQLEGVLYDFIRGEYDVLVTTSIIETGVDIPNVNTLFVENADRMGLAQLYQIRGRIGRSNRVAYAYFMYQPNKVLTEPGEKRLAAIRDFTELGSGFKIAMRDLAIRGAGNLLGKQQHGFIDSVGYDLYSDMLADAVAKKQGHQRPTTTNAEIDVAVEAYLPNDYVEDQRQKIELYKQIRKAQSKDELLDLQGDLIDRFGEYGPAVANLLLIGELKMDADQAMLSRIKQKCDNINLQFTKQASRYIKAADVMQAVAQTRFKSTMGTADDGSLTVRLIIQPKMTQQDWLHQLLKIVELLATTAQSQQTDQEEK